ncbi:MAG: DUF2142 domain-containing protein [Saprospiraceae bacterium]|nr:DUF2142 domain-containing protein [Saprospiraceae bacterium]
MPFFTEYKLYLWVALCFGLAYALLVPPFQSPDETAHFYRTAHIASGQLMGKKTADMRLGGYLPSSLSEFYQPFAKLRYDYAANVGNDDFQAAWSLALNPHDTVFTDFPNVGYYAPFPYLAQAAAIWPLKATGCRPMLLFYAGRLATLAAWLALILAALRLMPVLKGTMAALALLPSSMFLHASMSGDAVTNGLCFWLIAALFSLVFSEKNEPVANRPWLVASIFLSSAMVVLSKPVYFPLVLLAWLVPKTSFSSKWERLAFAGGLCATNFVLLAWWYSYAGSMFIPYGEYNPQFREGVQLNEGVQPHEQLAQVLAHPFSFLKTAVLSYVESGPATLAHYFGKFGWEKNYLPGWLIGLLALASILTAITDTRAAEKLRLPHRLAFAGLAVLMMGALALVLYMQWMPVGSDRVLALSGRYFFAVFPLFYFAVGGLFASQNWRWAGIVVKSALVLALAWGAWEVLSRYY